MHKPDKFLDVRVHDLGIEPSLSGLCVGYEAENWRATQFVKHLMEWLPEFSLTYSEIESIHSGNVVALMREAAKKLYDTEKFESRGEFGELILHAAIREVFGSLPAVSKIYYKSSRNNTVKGFDAVHVVESNGGIELWLGEAKFYKELSKATYDVVAELSDHTDRDYLRDEFLLIKGKIDPAWPHAAELASLISRNTSLDEVFKRVRIPVLLTYDSSCIASHKECSSEYIDDFREEVEKGYSNFAGKSLPANVSIHLFLLPLEDKKQLVQELDKQLKGWQGI